MKIKFLLDHFFLNGVARINFSLVERLTILFLLLTPIFFLSVNHWVVTNSVIASFLALIVVFHHKKNIQILRVPGILLIFIICFSYTFAIFISQLGRLDFGYKAYLDQSRWIIGFPIYLFVYWSRLNFARLLDIILPLCLIFGYVSSTYIIPSSAWGDRSTISFMDPLAFGFFSLSLGMICFSSIVYDAKSGKFDILSILKFFGGFLGVYLSIRSGSRSGWFAVPVVLMIVMYSAFKPRAFNTLFLTIISFFLILGIYFQVDIVHGRINQIFQELREYPWSGGMAPDGSVGLRITFYRLGFFYFSESPIFGWGQKGYETIKNSPELLSFSSQHARDFAFNALFHSEWTTQAVRYGSFGLAAVGAVFFIPLSIFLKNSFQGPACQKKVASMGFTFIICLFVASLTDEVFDSKQMISFTVIIIVGLLATLTRIQHSKKAA